MPEKFQTDGKASDCARWDISATLPSTFSASAQRSSVSLSVCLPACLSVCHCSLVPLTWHIVSCYAISLPSDMCWEFSEFSLCLAAKKAARVEQTGRHAPLLEKIHKIELHTRVQRTLWSTWRDGGRGNSKKKPEDWRALMQLRAEINLYCTYVWLVVVCIFLWCILPQLYL